MIMGSVLTMGHVCAMITTMEVTAQVNPKFFCYLVLNSLKNVIHHVIIQHSTFEFHSKNLKPKQDIQSVEQQLFLKGASF